MEFARRESKAVHLKTKKWEQVRGFWLTLGQPDAKYGQSRKANGRLKDTLLPPLHSTVLQSKLDSTLQGLKTK